MATMSRPSSSGGREGNAIANQELGFQDTRPNGLSVALLSQRLRVHSLTKSVSPPFERAHQNSATLAQQGYDGSLNVNS